MEKITLNQIEKKENRIAYRFSVTPGLDRFFSGEPFVIEYSESIEEVPDGVAAVPFVGTILPLVWLTDAVLELKELDRDFYDCIPRVRKGYEAMFPYVDFRGSLQVKQILDFSVSGTTGAALLFSGGLDAVSSLTAHIREKPALISIWGADVPYQAEEGWNQVYRGIAEYKNQYGLPGCVIHSSFRDFDREPVLTETFREKMQDGWWHGLKHALSLLCHVAPYTYLHRMERVYIASSFTKADEPITCASNPYTDNEVRFAGTRVCHDGYAFNRLGKIHNVVSYVNETGNAVHLHVCWQSVNGFNCCRCEKCYRTMAGLIAEGADPVDYGFEDAHAGMRKMQSLLAWEGSRNGIIKARWGSIQERVLQNEAQIQKTAYWKDMKFLKELDFTKENPVPVPLSDRIRGRLGEIPFYQMLHRMKMRVLHREDEDA